MHSFRARGHYAKAVADRGFSGAPENGISRGIWHPSMKDQPASKLKKGFGAYLGNSAWIMADRFLSSAIGLIVLAIVARLLGPEQYGAYAYVFALAQLFAVLGHAGLDALVMRELVDRPDDQPRTMGTAGGLRLIGYAIAATTILGYGLLLPGHSIEEQWLFVSATIFILFMPGQRMLDNWFLSRVEARYPAMGRISGALAGAALKISFVLIGLGVIAVGFAQAATMGLTFLVMLFFFRRRGGTPLLKWRFDWHRAREIFSESWMLFLGALLTLLYLKIDVVMLRWYEDSDTVGIYAVAASLSEAFYFVPAAVTATLFPRLVELGKSDETLFNVLFGHLVTLLTSLAYVIVAGTVLLGPFVIPLVFGKAYVEAGPILSIHVLAMPFIAMFFAFSRWVLIVKFVRFLLICQLIGATTNVGLNLILIPYFGMTGAAVTTVVSYGFASYLVLAFTDRTRPVFRAMTIALLTPWRAVAALRALRSGDILN